jgi:hypothetical protein
MSYRPSGGTSTQAVISMTAPRYGNRRADCPGYLEFIWRLPSTAPHPQAIAYITEDEGFYYGCYGTQVVSGPTVADVKSALFPLLDAAA